MIGGRIGAHAWALATFLGSLALVAAPAAVQGFGHVSALGLLVGPALLGCAVTTRGVPCVALPLGSAAVIWMLVGAAPRIADPIGPAIERLGLVPAGLVAMALALIRPPGRVRTAAIGVLLGAAAGLAGAGVLRQALTVIALAPLLAVTRRTPRAVVGTMVGGACVLGAADLVRLVAPPTAPVAGAVVDIALIAIAVACAALSDLRLRLQRAAHGPASTSLGPRLGAALGSPPLELAFPFGDGWVDDAGVAVPTPSQASLVRDAAHRVVGALSSSASLTDVPGSVLVPVLRQAGRVACARARLRETEVALVGSRSRLLSVADEERERLMRQVSTAVAQRTEDIAASVAHHSDGGAWALAAREAGDAIRRAVGPIPVGGDLSAVLAGVVPNGSASVTVDDDPRLSPEAARAVHHVVAEALANAEKHAEATTIAVRARLDDGEVVVEIEDDGVGGADPDGGGITGLGDRAAALGGALAVVSPQGAGTRVTLRIPVATGMRRTAVQSVAATDSAVLSLS